MEENALKCKSIPVNQHVRITLSYLATCAEYESIGHLFGVAESTVCPIFKKVCHAVSSNLSKIHHTGNSLQEVVDEYRTIFDDDNDDDGMILLQRKSK